MQTQTVQEVKRKKREPSRISQGDRTRIRQRKKGQPKCHARGTGRTDITPFGNFGFPAVNARPISEIQVAIQQGQSWGGMYSSYDFIQDVTLHTKLIGDLYPILQKHPQFSDTANWKKSTEAREVLTWMIDHFNDLVGKENQWVIVNPYDSESWNLVVFREYELSSFEYYAIPLSFLPKMREINTFLHDLLLDMISQVLSSTKIETWFNEMGDWSMQWLLDDYECRNGEEVLEPNEKKEWQETIHTYTDGMAVQYENLLCRNNSTIDQLENQLSQFKPANRIEKGFYDWILDGINLIRRPEDIYSFTFNPIDPEKDYDSPLTPDKYVFMAWDFEDHFFNCWESMLQSTWNEYGILPMMSWAITKQTDDKFNLPKPSDYPTCLTEFFRTGVEIINDFNKSQNHDDRS